MASIALYKRIKKYLTDKRVLILMHFVVSAAQDFQSFMKPLQDQKSHDTCSPPQMYVIHSLLQRFMKNRR